MGYKEISHTADWAISVWGEDIESLFIDAALGMYSLMGIQTNPSDVKKTKVILNGDDPESLLVSFLSELLYIIENNDSLFDKINLNINGKTLIAQLNGHGILSIQKVIKAVTYHNLEIINSNGLVQTEIVFDV